MDYRRKSVRTRGQLQRRQQACREPKLLVEVAIWSCEILDTGKGGLFTHKFNLLISFLPKEQDDDVTNCWKPP